MNPIPACSLARRRFSPPRKWTATWLPSSTRPTIITPIEQAEAFVARTGAIIHHGGSRAFYDRHHPYGGLSENVKK
jgi:hypothetical protein